VLLIGVASSLSYAGFSARLRLLRSSKRELEQLVAERTRALEAANRRLEELAHIDDLTSIANRRGLESWLRQAWQRCGEHARPMALMIIDVDHFKNYNDRHGHLAGDELLKRIVRELSSCLRRSEDIVGRYGGDEFVAVLPGADANATHEVAEAMRQRLRANSLGTISVGIVARQPRSGEDVSQLLREADAALYESKRRGRDCISIYGAAVASAEAVDAVAGAADPPAGR
jgi:diguanylate cyclase (GGDEF)-like protein